MHQNNTEVEVRNTEGLTITDLLIFRKGNLSNGYVENNSWKIIHAELPDLNSYFQIGNITRLIRKTEEELEILLVRNRLEVRNTF